MKKADQLGMNPSTASHRLIKDLLFKFISEAGCKCFRCGGELTRDTFSVDHRTPWLHSDNPTELYFDINNVAFSHFNCNSAAARRPYKYPTKEARAAAQKKNNKKAKKAQGYCPDRRRAQYLRTGK